MTRCWIAQLALVVRGLTRGYPPPVPFAIVSMVVTGVVTVGWRTALAALSPQVLAGVVKNQLPSQHRNSSAHGCAPCDRVALSCLVFGVLNCS